MATLNIIDEPLLKALDGKGMGKLIQLLGTSYIRKTMDNFLIQVWMKHWWVSIVVLGGCEDQWIFEYFKNNMHMGCNGDIP